LKDLKKLKVIQKKDKKLTKLEAEKMFKIIALVPPNLNVPTVHTFDEELQEEVFVKLLDT
jgi:hypothetical protein